MKIENFPQLIKGGLKREIFTPPKTLVAPFTFEARLLVLREAGSGPEDTWETRQGVLKVKLFNQVAGPCLTLIPPHSQKHSH